jgi:hypothetical protein
LDVVTADVSANAERLLRAEERLRLAVEAALLGVHNGI